jgi:hypothetical protein
VISLENFSIELPLHYWGWVENSAGGDVCVRAPAEAPLVSAPAAHGMQISSKFVVQQKVGAALLVIVAETLFQVFM